MPHPSTILEIIQALDSNARSIVEFFSRIPDRPFFDGTPEQWSPAHHLIHLTAASRSVQSALRSGKLPLHPTGSSRTYAEVRDAAAASLGATPRDRLRDMGRTVVIPLGASQADLVSAFVSTSAELRAAASSWTDDTLDRHAMQHPLIGQMTAREMLLFCVVHERHHLRLVQTRVGNT